MSATTTVTVIDVDACPIAAIETRATRDELSPTILRTLDLVWPFLRASDLRTNHNVVIYRGDPGAPGGAAIEVGVQVDRRFTETTPDGVHCREIPAARVARAVHRGAYDRLGETHAAVHDWCKAEGHRLTGLSWEIYGDWSDDPAELETEVAWEVAG